MFSGPLGFLWDLASYVLVASVVPLSFILLAIIARFLQQLFEFKNLWGYPFNIVLSSPRSKILLNIWLPFKASDVIVPPKVIRNQVFRCASFAHTYDDTVPIRNS